MRIKIKLWLLAFLLTASVLPQALWGQTPPTTSSLNVKTLAATQISKTAYKLNGVVSDPDAAQGSFVTLYAKFKYSKTKTTSCVSMANATETQTQTLYDLDFYTPPGFFNFSQDITGLPLDTDYYYCALVSTDSGFSSNNVLYGNISFFETSSTLPKITKVITETSGGIVTDDSAQIVGSVELNPQNANSNVWVKFKYSDNWSKSCAALPDAINTPKVQLNAGPAKQTFYADLKDLQDETTYYYCAVASLSADFIPPIYGLVQEFTTLKNVTGGGSIKDTKNLGEVTTDTAIDIDDTEATLRGTYAGGKVGYAYFRISTAEIPPIFCNDIYGSDMLGITATDPDKYGKVDKKTDFSAHVTDLEPSTTYYYCAVVSNYAKDPTKIKYGDVYKLQTLPCKTCDETVITTKPALVLGTKSAALNGNFRSTKEIKVYFKYKEKQKQSGVPDNTDPYDPDSVWESTPTKSYKANSSGAMYYTLKNLKKDTAYMFYAVGETDDEYFYGDTLEFRTNKFDGVGGDLGGYDPSNPGIDVGGSNTGGGPGITVTPGDDNCPAGSTGVFPKCVTEPEACPQDEIGDPPNCFDPGDTPNDEWVTVTAKADPVAIEKGGVSTISWQSTNAQTCKLNGYDVGTSGSASTGPLNNSTSYTVACTGKHGSASDTADVYVNITGGQGGGDLIWVKVKASPWYVKSGESANITWESSGADFCDSGGHGTGTSGSFSTGPITTGTSFAVTCSGQAGTASDTAYVDISSKGLGGTLCQPKTLQSTVPCNDGQSGTFTLERVATCPSDYGEPVWGAWKKIDDQCKDLGTICKPTVDKQEKKCLFYQTGKIIRTRTNICKDPFGKPEPGEWQEVLNTCDFAGGVPPVPTTGLCKPEKPQTTTKACPVAGDKGLLSLRRTSVCKKLFGDPEWSNWEIYADTCSKDTPPDLPTDLCEPYDQTKIEDCFSGSKIEQRSSTCPTPYGQPVWGDWKVIENTCKDDNGNPYLCQTGIEKQIKSCPAGYTGVITEERKSSCPDPKGSPKWGAWTITQNSCKDPKGNPIPPGTPGNPGGPGSPGTPPGGPGNGDDDNGNGNNGNGNNGNGNNSGNNGNGNDGGQCKPKAQTADIDNDNIINFFDDDIDGDGVLNESDPDIDGDCIPNLVDATPKGPGSKDDFDGSGVPNGEDTDLNGNGVPNYLDRDTDGDGIPNALDNDDDGDGIPDLIDVTPRGPHGDRFGNDWLFLGAKAKPPSDAIVHYHEGVETVFARQINRNPDFAEGLGFSGGNLSQFALDMAHTLAKYYFGYINSENLEIRVSKPDVSAYELRQLGNTVTVYEYYKDTIIDIRSQTIEFKQKNPYEYYFRRIFK